MKDLKSLISWGIVGGVEVGACSQEFRTANVATVIVVRESYGFCWFLRVITERIAWQTEVQSLVVATTLKTDYLPQTLEFQSTKGFVPTSDYNELLQLSV